MRQASLQTLDTGRRALQIALLTERKEAQGGQCFRSESHSDRVASQDSNLGLSGPRAHRPNHSCLLPTAASPWPGRLTIDCPLHRPDSLHARSPTARPPTAVGRSPAAPSPVGSVPRACGLFPRPSSPTGLRSAPAPCSLLRTRRRPTGVWTGGVPAPAPCGEGGRVRLWEWHWFKNTQRK